MQLPQEILDQVVGELVFEELVSEAGRRGSLDRWEDFIAYGNYRLENEDPELYEYETTLVNTELDLEVLSTLRLVSRQWNYAVSRLLKQNLWWNIKFDGAESIKKIAECCNNANGGFFELVRRISLTDMDDLKSFVRRWSHEPDKFEGQDVDGNYIVLHSPYSDSLAERREQRADRKLHYDKKKEHDLLRRLFDRMTQIECFSVSFPEATCEQGLKVECYDMEGVSNMIATLQYGLQSPAFQHLRNLSLMVPSTWHIGRLASSVSQEARGRLTQLRLVIQDATGPCGSSDLTIYDETNDEDSTDIMEGEFAPSNLQAAYPNREHQDALWEFVASCRSLESLAIGATHYLDLRRLQWYPASGLRGLQHLVLHRVWTDTSSILRILSPSPGSDLPSIVRRVSLDDVKIYGDGGDWETVFDHVRDRCPDLEVFGTYQLTYFSDHPRYEYNNRPYERVDRVWTSSDEDEQSLLMLQEKLRSSAE